jgi:hypothetical protein
LEIGEGKNKREVIQAGLIFVDKEGHPFSTPFPVTLEDGDTKEL